VGGIAVAKPMQGCLRIHVAVVVEAKKDTQSVSIGLNGVIGLTFLM